MLSVIKSAFNNNYVSAEDQGASPLIANRTAAKGWETFDVINNPDATISFRSSANNKYVTADLNENTKLIARATTIQAWEKFKRVDRGNGRVALQAVANNQYVCADMNLEGVLYANDRLRPAGKNSSSPRSRIRIRRLPPSSLPAASSYPSSSSTKSSPAATTSTPMPDWSPPRARTRFRQDGRQYGRTSRSRRIPRQHPSRDGRTVPHRRGEQSQLQPLFRL